MSRTIRKKRDSTGLFKGSYQRKTKKIGRRQQAGVPCPKK